MSYKTMKNTVIAIIGTTGVGKSKLSISLSKALNGQVINADSMQVYNGLDTMTNKHPISERFGVEHHLLGHIKDLNTQYTVKDYVSEATTTIQQIIDSASLPIIVGGTHYYVQSLLFNNELPDEESNLNSNQTAFLETADTSQLFDKLSLLDPVIAQKFHPRDRRKISTALKICFTTGKPASDIYKQQQSDGKEASRYNSLIFWVYAQPKSLYPRLDSRVDDMLEHGELLQEVSQMANIYKSSTPHPDLESGIWQVIGFKEFLPYIESNTDSDRLNGLDEMKKVTRKYADTQIKWIRKKLLPIVESSRNEVQIVLLDASDLSNWEANVEKRAIEIAKAFLNHSFEKSLSVPQDKTLHELLYPKNTAWSTCADAWKHYECDLCLTKTGEKFVCVGETQWNAHLRHRRHRQAVKHIREKEAFQKWKLTTHERINV
ncbi:IPP transferase-domain-containing protein [Lipomyces oligophaga]|uniref:IPP transferase-domain-containing protein n=1 Tax=Lipomyces oligophaga TaxID=45792 RepID=UPI0034CE7189